MLKDGAENLQIEFLDNAVTFTVGKLELMAFLNPVASHDLWC